MIGWLGSARRSLSEVWAQRLREDRPHGPGIRRFGCREPGKNWLDEPRSPGWFSLGLALFLAGCRCEPEPVPEPNMEDCNRACAVGATCPRADQAGCAARCRSLLDRSRSARASSELRQLMACAAEHPCAGAFGVARGHGPCATTRRALDARLSACQPGTLSSRVVERGSLLEESLGCVAPEACMPTTDGGAFGGPCQTASTCNAVCCPACGGEKTLRVRACIDASCASSTVACQLVVDSPNCRAE